MKLSGEHIINIAQDAKLENVGAICFTDAALLVGLTLTKTYKTLTESSENNFKTKHEKQIPLVLLPAEFSLEHFREQDVKIGSYCVIKSFEKTSEGEFKVAFNCINRCFVKDIKVKGADIKVDVLLIKSAGLMSAEQENIKQDILNRFKEYLKYDRVGVSEIELIKNSTQIDEFVKNIAFYTKFDLSAKRKLLNEIDETKRLEFLNSELETRIFEQSADKGKDVILYYKNKINNLDISADIKTAIYQELNRLKSARPGQSEYSNIIDWLDRIIALPWNIIKEENKNLELAKKVLNETHYGMDLLKQRILDYITLRALSGKDLSQIICLYGPPGVGKSTIVKSIAKSLNKDYYAFSLGGVSNPEEINGMKRFYVGAKPGRILEGISQAGSINCIILLDEIDKMATNGQKGDPSAVLLDVLDKNQNSSFKDKYFDVPFDLSKVMFIATANYLDLIPDPLRNRMEILTIDGYSLNEKIHIAKNFILTKFLKELGLDQNIISMSDDVVLKIIEDYTFESGVRQLERAIENVVRKSLIEQYTKTQTIQKTEITMPQVRDYLGDYCEGEADIQKEGEVGVVNKMSVMGPIGNISRLEISLTNGTGEQILSDNLVGTAKWTFKTVFGLLQTKAAKWGIDPTVFKTKNFYIHSPHHGISHDGASGGVADVVCLVSAIKDFAINHTLSFTGEITLKGNIIAIGGVKEKVLAAQRNKIKTVVLPQKNKKDVQKLSLEIIGDLKFKYVDNIDEVYDFVFEKNGNF